MKDIKNRGYWSLYYFLQLHVTLQLPKNKNLFKKKSINRSMGIPTKEYYAAEKGIMWKELQDL